MSHIRNLGLLPTTVAVVCSLGAFSCGDSPATEEQSAAALCADQKPTSKAPAYVTPRPEVWAKGKYPTGVYGRPGETLNGTPVTSQGSAVSWIQTRLDAYGGAGVGYFSAINSLFKKGYEDYLKSDAYDLDRENGEIVEPWSDRLGSFGSATQAAVSSFQAWNGLAANGIVDERTAELLAREVRKTAAPAYNPVMSYAKLEGGVCISHLNKLQKLDYLSRLYQAQGGTLSSKPGWVHFVQIRGFMNDCAVQNVPNLYNDTVFALINNDADVSLLNLDSDNDGIADTAAPGPARLIAMVGSADFGDMPFELRFPDFGKTQWLGYPVMGPVIKTEDGSDVTNKGLFMAAPDQIVNYPLGNHDLGCGYYNLVSGDPSTRTWACKYWRGLGLTNGAVALYTDANHNWQIEGPEFINRVTGTTANRQINVHAGGDFPYVAKRSAGCLPLPAGGAKTTACEVHDDGSCRLLTGYLDNTPCASCKSVVLANAYDNTAKSLAVSYYQFIDIILKSGQVKPYIDKRIAELKAADSTLSDAQALLLAEADVYGPRVVPKVVSATAAGSGQTTYTFPWWISWGMKKELEDAIRKGQYLFGNFPYAIVDGRSLPRPSYFADPCLTAKTPGTYCGKNLAEGDAEQSEMLFNCVRGPNGLETGVAVEHKVCSDPSVTPAEPATVAGALACPYGCASRSIGRDVCYLCPSDKPAPTCAATP